jgi:hypothetical protein
VDEEKKKGLDGKACWKGYKLAGTKKKGGKTVDNCVKVSEDKAFDNVVACSAKKSTVSLVSSQKIHPNLKQNLLMRNKFRRGMKENAVQREVDARYGGAAN